MRLISEIWNLGNLFEDHLKFISCNGNFGLPVLYLWLLTFLFSAILAVKDEKMQCAVPKTKPVLEEFIPLKKEQEEDDGDDSKKGNDYRDQKNWMSSVQLWNSDDNHHSNYKLETKVQTICPKNNNYGVLFFCPFDNHFIICFSFWMVTEK